MGNTLSEIKARMAARLTSEAAKLEGSFNMDNLGAVATELARFHAEDVDTLLDRAFLDTALGEDLDRRALDFDMERKLDEQDDDFRERILERARNPIAPGNENSYIAWAKEVQGVGRAKCFGEWAGPGTVKVSILTTDGTTPDAELLGRVYKHIEAIRPIGAEITVSAAVPVEVYVDAGIVLESDADEEMCRELFSQALDIWFKTIAYDRKTTYLSYYKVGEMLFSIPGILDVTALSLCGEEKSVPLGKDEFFILGGVTFHA